MAMIVNKGYEDKNGVKYDDLLNVHFEKKEDMATSLGKYVAETDYKDNMFLSSSWNLTNGIYLYQSYFDPKIALRIYRDFASYKYVHHDDAKLIKELLERGKNVLLTDFPMGVITIEDYVVGQAIPFYEDYDTLAKVVINKKDELSIMKYYLEIMKILKELYNNSIIYADVRSRNFMINRVNNLVKLIDFESQYISFDDRLYKEMIKNIKITINEINDYLNIKFKIDKEDSLDNIEETLLEENYKRSR